MTIKYNASNFAYVDPLTNRITYASVGPMKSHMEVPYTDYYSPNSTSIQAVWYNRDEEILYVEFVSGDGIYTFEDVTRDLYRQFKEDESAGRFFAKYLRNWSSGGEKISLDTVFRYVEPAPVEQDRYEWTITYGGEQTIRANSPEEALRIFRQNHPGATPTHINMFVELSD